eukprot:1865985-Pyramimonas_sp.AAC.1
MLQQWLSWAINRLNPTEARDLNMFCRTLDFRSMGSMCSGTDSPILVQRAYDKVLEDRMGLRRPTTHAFSAEIDPGKRAFLKDMYGYGPCQSLFEDVIKLECEQKALNALSGQPVDIPHVTDLTAGFPCTDGSQ